MRWLALLMLGACSYTPPEAIGGDDDDMPVDAPTTVDAPVNLTCPASFQAFGGPTFYLLRNETGPGRTWKQSEQDCELQGPGVHLATVETIAEADAIKTHLGAGREYWVGMVQLVADHDKDDDWFWITGEPGLDHWAPGEPNDGDSPTGPIVTDEDSSDQFAVMLDTGQLGDRKVSDPRPAICECDGKSLDSNVIIP